LPAAAPRRCAPTTSKSSRPWRETPAMPDKVASPGRIALVGLAAAGLLMAGCGGGGSSSNNSERDKAIAGAQRVYAATKKAGADLSKGPCLADGLPGQPDWVADVAHDPRQPVDDVPSNQCARYRAGAAHHFVELDPNGKLIRAQ
jgi:hypothetical protein